VIRSKSRLAYQCYRYRERSAGEARSLRAHRSRGVHQRSASSTSAGEGRYGLGLRSIQGWLSTMERNRESFYRGSLETKGNFRGKPDATLGMATTESVVFYL